MQSLHNTNISKMRIYNKLIYLIDNKLIDLTPLLITKSDKFYENNVFYIRFV